MATSLSHVPAPPGCCLPPATSPARAESGAAEGPVSHARRRGRGAGGSMSGQCRCYPGEKDGYEFVQWVGSYLSDCVCVTASRRI